MLLGKVVNKLKLKLKLNEKKNEKKVSRMLEFPEFRFAGDGNHIMPPEKYEALHDASMVTAFMAGISGMKFEDHMKTLKESYSKMVAEGIVDASDVVTYLFIHLIRSVEQSIIEAAFMKGKEMEESRHPLHHRRGDDGNDDGYTFV